MDRVFTILDFNGDTGRPLNLSGFTNYQKPVSIDVLQKAVADGKIVAISPESVAKLENDLEKAFQTDFEASDKFSALVTEVKSYRRVLVQRGNEVVEYLVKAVHPDIEKAGGEGSRGGKVVGHTKSGKPIYETKTITRHTDFSHSEAKKHISKYHEIDETKTVRLVGTKHKGKQVQDHTTYYNKEGKAVGYKYAVNHSNIGPGVRTYHVEIEPNASKDIEKGDELYALQDGIGMGDKRLPLKKKGSDIKAAFGTVVARLTAESEGFMTTMAKCLEEIGTPPTESPWNAADRLVGKRYSWEVCDSSVSVGGNSQRNACREYNNAFDALCSNFRTLKLCKAYMENLKDDTEYELNPSLYILLF